MLETWQLVLGEKDLNPLFSKKEKAMELVLQESRKTKKFRKKENSIKVSKKTSYKGTNRKRKIKI